MIGRTVFSIGTALALALLAAPALAAPPTPATVVDDSARSSDDRALDADRKPIDILRFTGVRPGNRIVERFPGEGYYTRLLSKLVGPHGKVYVVLIKRDDGTVFDLDKAKAVEGGNVVLVARDATEAIAPEPLDVVISQQNYHDLHVGREAATGAAMFNAKAFAALKRGGTYVVIDHDAVAGAGATNSPTLHRIEMKFARAEIEAAGFRFVGSAETLRNPADPRTAVVSDPSVRGHTDRFMMKFRKP